MIRSVWIYVWIGLLVMQVAFVSVHYSWIRQQQAPVVKLDPGLVQLAEMTQRMVQLQTIENPGETNRGHSRSDKLLLRESMMLEMHRLQGNLKDNGVETKIVEDLMAFLDTVASTDDVVLVNDYIRGILDWIQPHAVAGNSCHLERLSLFPDSGSRLPVLAFELAGAPALMAESLLRSAGESSRWDLVEMDLLLPDRETACWLRGSFAFLEMVGAQ